MTTYNQLVTAALARVSEVSVAEVSGSRNNALVLDIREPDETVLGTIPGAHILPRGILERDIDKLVSSRSQPIVMYCASGSRSALAAATLLDMGYERVSSLKGGFEAWKAAGLPWGDPAGLTSEQRTRYARHVSLPEVGERGQLELLNSKALIVGAGGLGSPAAMYLAAAGVGTIGLVDDDVVDSSNLQRQVVHSVDRIGIPKARSAAETIAGLNSDVKIETYEKRLISSNAEGIVAGYDVVIDCADNFPTRYLINDVSLRTRVPVVHGSIFRFEGQVALFDPYRSACYRCLHRERHLRPNWHRIALTAGSWVFSPVSSGRSRPWRPSRSSLASVRHWRVGCSSTTPWNRTS